MTKQISFKLLPYILLLLVSSVVTTWLVLTEYYTPAIISATVAFITTGGIIWFYNQNTRKLMFLFDSIENGEYAFQFTKTKRYRHNALVNQSMNRVRELLAMARDETIEQEKYYQLILESVTTGIVVVNNFGHVFQTNREAIRLLGIDPFTHILQLSRLDEQFPSLVRDIVAGESRQLTYNTERGSVTLSLHASTITRQGETLKIMTLTDIETELSDREIESWLRLIRVLTHEIMNSMGPITSISESLVDRIGDKDQTQIRDGLITISKAAKDLTSVSDSLMWRIGEDGDNQIRQELDVINKTAKNLTSISDSLKRRIGEEESKMIQQKLHAIDQVIRSLTLISEHLVEQIGKEDHNQIRKEIKTISEIITSLNSTNDALAKVGQEDDKQIRHGLETISKTAKNLTSFVDSYRKFTRIPVPEPTLFYLCEFMESLRALALATVPERAARIELIISLEADDLILYADRGLVSQVALNLLKNAIEATVNTELARIEFSAVVDSREQVIITVQDNGPGISQEVADHIFIPFFTTKTGGSGVGLSLSRQIMRLHGGTLNYKPVIKGTGSIFTLTFK